MQYDRRVVDKERGIIQITTSDERWYYKEVDGIGKYLPSTTWVTSYYPKGIGFEKYLVSMPSWEKAQELLIEAGIKGTFTHKGVEKIIQDKKISYDVVLEAQGITRELTTEEYANVMAFADWYNITEPKTIKTECTVFAPNDTHAGTIDYVCEIDGEPWIIDFKTGASVYSSYECQLTAYRIALGIDARLGVLQLGVKRNSLKKWKLTEVYYQPELWEAVYKIWEKETKGIQPLQRDYPLEIKLNTGETHETTKKRK